MTNDAKPDFMLETYIKCSPQKLWDAMCSPEMTARYNVAGGAIQGKLEAGSAYKYMNSSGFVTLTGEIIAADPPHRLEMTFVPGWLGAHAKQSRNIYEIEAVGDVTKLTILHYGLTDELEDVRRGWSKMAASLKSLIETGEELKFV